MRAGELVETTYRRPPLSVDWSYLVLALIGSFYLLIGVYTVLRERRPEALLFYLWCLASAVVYLFTPSGLWRTPPGVCSTPPRRSPAGCCRR